MKSKTHRLILTTLLFMALIFSTGISASQAYAAKIKKSGITLTVGKSKTLKTGVSGKVSTWSSSNKKIATVDKNGKVKAVKAGKATITAKHSNKNSYTFAITVKNADATATSIETSTVDGGDFYPGANDQKIFFTLDKKSTAVKLSILDDEDKTVFTKTFSTISAKKEKSYNWNGKNSKGKYVPEGLYKIRIAAGSIKTDSDYFKVYVRNPFDDGVGSKDNPYEISTIKQFELIGQYNGRYFKQTKDLDFEYGIAKSFFTNDLPFTGSYNGDGNKISNITLESSLFIAIGSEGSLENINIVNATMNTTGKFNGILVGENNGTIDSCNVDGFANGDSGTALIAGINNNLVKNCTTSGSAKATMKVYSYSNGYGAGGIVSYNSKTGRILSSSSNAQVGSVNNGNSSHYTGGIVGVNDGIVIDCNSDVSFFVSSNWYKAGGVAGRNTSKIQNSYYTGNYNVNIACENEGVIE